MTVPVLLWPPAGPKASSLLSGPGALLSAVGQRGGLAKLARLPHQANLATSRGYRLGWPRRRKSLSLKPLMDWPSCKLGHGSNEGNTGAVEPSATNPALSPIGIMVNGL